MKLKLPTPGTYGQTEADGTPEELADFFRALGKEPLAPLPISVPSVFAPLDVCPLGDGVHRYPTVWLSVSPPTCELCGKPATWWIQPMWTWTVSPCTDLLNPMPPCRTVLGQDGNSYQLADLQGHRGCTD